MIITIDGPTASGKSTVARELANKLGCYYLNTGFLYRALSYLLMSKCGYTLEDLKTPSKKDIDCVLDPHKFEYQFKGGSAHVLFDGQDITPYLKTKKNDQAASIVSGCKIVRDALIEYQRAFTKNADVIAEGRDTGTVIFPNADIKIYLTASVDERARRWQRYKKYKGNQYTFEQAVAEVKARDERDSSRAIAPLKIPDDAIVVDSTDFTQQQTIDFIERLIADRS